MEETREFVVASELPSPASPQPKKKPKWWNILIDVAVVLVFVATIAASANVIYLSTAFDTPFFVNGMSMYPTLNPNAKNSRGETLGWWSGESAIGDQVDYGYAQSLNFEKGDALQRYDVILTYYYGDFEVDEHGDLRRDEAGKLILRNRGTSAEPKSKIKRVIGLPGETVRFEAIAPGDSENARFRAWGKVTINPGLETAKVLEPKYTVEDFEKGSSRSYNCPSESYADVTLGEHEYYVLGDNRGNSSDSRRNGAILDEMMIAKACLIVGKRTLDGSDKPGSPWEYVFTPWNYRRVE